MSQVVVDASALTTLYASRDPRRARVRAHLSAGDWLFAPAHIDVEVISALRGLARNDPLVEREAPQALKHLATLRVRRMGLSPLLSRVWELRDQMTAYDAAYVALAERLGAVVLTCDVKMTRATQARCGWELIA